MMVVVGWVGGGGGFGGRGRRGGGRGYAVLFRRFDTRATQQILVFSFTVLQFYSF